MALEMVSVCIGNLVRSLLTKTVLKKAWPSKVASRVFEMAGKNKG